MVDERNFLAIVLNVEIFQGCGSAFIFCGFESSCTSQCGSGSSSLKNAERVLIFINEITRTTNFLAFFQFFSSKLSLPDPDPHLISINPRRDNECGIADPGGSGSTALKSSPRYVCFIFKNGKFIRFVLSFRKVPKEFHLDYDKLEDRPSLPSSLTGAGPTAHQGSAVGSPSPSQQGL